jgi:hypothetical protein
MADLARTVSIQRVLILVSVKPKILLIRSQRRSVSLTAIPALVTSSAFVRRGPE